MSHGQGKPQNGQGNVREKSGNFVRAHGWTPCLQFWVDYFYIWNKCQRSLLLEVVLHIDTTDVTEIAICPAILISILWYHSHWYISISCFSGFAQKYFAENHYQHTLACQNDNFHFEYNIIYIESNGNAHLLATFFQHFESGGICKMNLR